MNTFLKQEFIVVKSYKILTLQKIFYVFYSRGMGIKQTLEKNLLNLEQTTARRLLQ